MPKLKSPFVIISGILLFLFWCALLLYVTNLFKNRIQSNNRSMFQRAALVLEEKMENYIHGLQGMGGVVIAHNYNPKISDISRYAEFRNYFDNFPGALGFGFVRNVNEKDLGHYYQKMKQQDPDFTIKKLDKKKKKENILSLRPLSLIVTLTFEDIILQLKKNEEM